MCLFALVPWIFVPLDQHQRLQKRATSDDTRNVADESARAMAAAGIDVVGVELRRMTVVVASRLSSSNVKRRIATMLARARCDQCPPYDPLRAPHDQPQRCQACRVRRAVHRRDDCAKCHAKLGGDFRHSVYRVERVVDSWRTKIDPFGGKVHRDRNALNSLRLVASVAAVTNGKRLLQYSHSGNK